MHAKEKPERHSPDFNAHTTAQSQSFAHSFTAHFKQLVKSEYF
jgi:hypothetical protein